MKRILWIIVIIAFIMTIVFSCSTHSGETSNGFSGSVTKYQYGNITYLVFKASGSDGGVAVVNYTSDSMEYEFLHSPTKTMYYGSGSDSSQYVKVRQPGRSVQAIQEYHCTTK